MFSKLLLITGVAAQLVAADRISTWLSDMCTNANMGTTDPLPIGTCIEFGQAQSYILTKDPGNLYNLYSGGGCAHYVGQVSLSSRCLAVGDDATAIMNIGPQNGRRWIRGANPLGKNEPALEKRVEGDTYQCPNIPSAADYFFVVQRSSAVHGDTFADEDSHIRNDFLSAFNAAYQNPSGQNRVSSYTPLGGGVEDVQMTLSMNQGVIHDISPVDIENLTNSLFDFRDMLTGRATRSTSSSLFTLAVLTILVLDPLQSSIGTATKSLRPRIHN
ncbi:hypothetical protein DFP72DRAFT_1081923 [Ephemerocybe angulata]|uniref:Uncharacterized protein n=1 Tax=Ephemerocybe angulata TaxID=980116 RepID=A0A8H6HAX2_9AGAR|nr:hypothetical protein DFP72DRAFT_1081923 [Tulosesus angulatus]